MAMGRPRSGGTFEGTPCRICGRTERYERNGACCYCQRERSRRQDGAAKYASLQEHKATEGEEVKVRSMLARLTWHTAEETDENQNC